jgi:hypothetical protein
LKASTPKPKPPIEPLDRELLEEFHVMPEAKEEFVPQPVEFEEAPELEPTSEPLVIPVTDAETNAPTMPRTHDESVRWDTPLPTDPATQEQTAKAADKELLPPEKAPKGRPDMDISEANASPDDGGLLGENETMLAKRLADIAKPYPTQKLKGREGLSDVITDGDFDDDKEF